VLSAAKSAVRAILKRLGWELTRSDKRLGYHTFTAALQRHQVEIASVFDIGVAYGTPDLYAAHPKADLYLFDPTEEALPYMEEQKAFRGAKVFNIALGAETGVVTLHVPANHVGSTLFDEEAEEAHVARSVPLRRFDDLISDFATPALCKMDVQGAELLVLRGMPKAIERIDYFILEMSTIPTLKQAPDFNEVHSFMTAKGFVLFDLLGLMRRPLDGALAQMDVAYVRTESRLRADRRWG
jgi:FkbM family methyltransferase